MVSVNVEVEGKKLFVDPVHDTGFIECFQLLKYTLLKEII